VRFAFSDSRRRHFERIPDWPRRLGPIDLAIGRFNPGYGQGMTVAARRRLSFYATFWRAAVTMSIRSTV
jgi:hypothetical protein